MKLYCPSRRIFIYENLRWYIFEVVVLEGDYSYQYKPSLGAAISVGP